MLTSAAGSERLTWTRMLSPTAGFFFESLTFLIRLTMLHLVSIYPRSIQDVRPRLRELDGHWEAHIIRTTSRSAIRRTTYARDDGQFRPGLTFPELTPSDSVLVLRRRREYGRSKVLGIP